MNKLDLIQQYKIDLTKLSRDYSKYPFKPHSKDMIPKLDIEYLYLQLNIPYLKLVAYLGISSATFIRLIKKYKITKTFLTTNTKEIKRLIEKYNINIAKLKRNYIINPLIRRANHKFEMPNKTDLKYLYLTLNMSIKDLCIFFGVKHSCLGTWIAKYNLKKPHKKVILITYITNLQKYGVKNQFERKEIQNKIANTINNRYGAEKITQTTYFKEKLNTCNKTRMEKVFTTKKKNNTLGNKSKQEDIIYNLLITKFKKVERQHRSDKYPYFCDFYIPEKDLYIEYQEHWTHGSKPFENTAEDQIKLQKWKDKNTKFFNIAIDVWTRRDPMKRKIAKENHLNYLEFFSIAAFKSWFYNIATIK